MVLILSGSLWNNLASVGPPFPLFVSHNSQAGRARLMVHAKFSNPSFRDIPLLITTWYSITLESLLLLASVDPASHRVLIVEKFSLGF
jgi:hypothetical protein